MSFWDDLLAELAWAICWVLVVVIFLFALVIFAIIEALDLLTPPGTRR
jgi:hypothetical protein